MEREERMRTKCCCESPLGRIWLEAEKGAVTGLSLERKPVDGAPQTGDCEKPAGPPEDVKVLRQACLELAEYFAGTRRQFTLPLRMEGTCFQKKVWEALRSIPYGETRSYEQIAQAVGSPRACRAVGGANHCNPIMILVPCHRVVGKNGSLVGFGGGLEAKAALLRLEAQFSGNPACGSFVLSRKG